MSERATFHKQHSDSPWSVKTREDELADKIAGILKEGDAQAFYQIRRIVLTCGLEFAKDLLRATNTTLKNGGLMTEDGSRKRTPGGVFFKLAKNRMTMDERISVFGFARRKSKGAQKGTTR